MIANYHTHNVMCNHAECVVEDYTKAAVEAGLQVIGHSDHFPFPWDALNDGRMRFTEIPEYIRQVNADKDKYGDRIKVLLGGEIEYLSDFDAYYDRLLSSGDLDYLILGQHLHSVGKYATVNVYCDYKGDNPPVMEYAKSCMDGMKKGFFLYLAHPDLIFLNDLKVTDELMRAIDHMVDQSVKNDYVLELNAGGARGKKLFANTGERHPYPCDIFWQEVAKTNIRCIIGADAHHPNAVCDEAIPYLEEYAHKMGLNLIHTLEQ